MEVPMTSSQARVGNRLHSFSLHSSWAQKGLGTLWKVGGQAEAPSSQLEAIHVLWVLICLL